MKSEITIKTVRCKGCGICAAFCPKSVLAVSELGKIQVVNKEACIGCGQCELRCPDYAILWIESRRQHNEQSEIDAGQ